MNLEGKLLGNRYEILEKIGSGGMATVYKARCHVLNRYVAVKILRDEFTTDEEFIKRFQAEAQAAASLTHPNIVSIYDVGVEDNLYYIVMELIQGKTLKEIIVEEQGPLSWKWSINVAIQIASALEVAHKNNIVHRDIKPHNIIITEDGIAKVTDFGIAKAVSNSTITAFGTTIGSVHYFSPEHARGGFTDAKSDLYSLGVVMYEMVTGRVPFDADTPVSIALKHMQEEPVEPIQINPNIPVAVNKIIMKALKKDVTLRYQTSTEMLRDLRMALKNPSGDFIEQKEYIQDAPTQKMNTDMYGNLNENTNSRGDKNNKKQNKFIGFIKRHKVLSSIIGLILLFGISLGGTLAYLNITNPKEVELPNLVGKTTEEAQEILNGLNLVMEVKSEEYNSEYEAGKIISQDPAITEKYNTVKEKSTVSVVVSKGIETTVVPKVVGLEKEEAIDELEKAKLKAEVVEETSRKVEEGYVISQEVEAESEANVGDTIKIHVSTGTGIKQVSVQNVVGQTESNARTTLEGQGLKVTVNYVDATTDDGKVTKQSISAGTTVDEGTTVTLTVNKVAQTKSVSIIINLKQITGGYTEDEDEESTVSKTVNISVNGETRTGVDKNETAYSSISLSGKEGDSLDITVTITDPKTGSQIYRSTKTVTLGSQDSVTFN